mmetsp:Transcript_12301/g.33815  ORF Transcript_12301/g.33815 Transcript_12301/m.33815 type:complete len:152 (+) Transcript_12301:455-910(+)
MDSHDKAMPPINHCIEFTDIPICRTCSLSLLLSLQRKSPSTAVNASKSIAKASSIFMLRCPSNIIRRYGIFAQHRLLLHSPIIRSVVEFRRQELRTMAMMCPIHSLMSHNCAVDCGSIPARSEAAADRDGETNMISDRIRRTALSNARAPS